MNTNTPTGLIPALLGLALLGSGPLLADELPSPLEAKAHPSTPAYDSLFTDELVPLDTRLSWKDRFRGDETFNADEALPPTSSLSERLSGGHSASADATTVGFDTSGVIKQLRIEEGKLKVEHGPIDRLGMPAMTMMFRVEDPTQLTGLGKGEEIEFDVANTAAGFSITRLAKKSAGFDATGVVKQVRAVDNKLKVEHGPIDRLGMPGMTMMFRVENPAQIAGLEPGTEIEFNVDNTAAGFTITSLQPVSGGMTYDASGTVKSIRAEQGKVKIEHGPIDKLGMPGMTMLFKVADPAMLAGLQRDMPVEFDVINGPAGFEITRISSGESANMQMTGTRLCYVVGPIGETAHAREIEQRYLDRGATAQLKSASERTYVGTMVYIDGQASREAALVTAKELQENGFKDYRLLNEAGKRNAISLGVFGQPQNATRTRERAVALNYPAKTEKRYRRKTLFRLHFAQTGAAQALQLLSADELQSGIRQVPGDCPAQEES